MIREDENIYVILSEEKEIKIQKNNVHVFEDIEEARPHCNLLNDGYLFYDTL